MANDGGLVAKTEQWIADTLAALTNGGKDVFRTADVWKHQLLAKKGGTEAFDRYEPFAFVGYNPEIPGREGDYDLKQVLGFSVAIGIKSKYDGVARIGNSNHLGCSKIRELVIAALDKEHPDVSIACDDLFYVSEFVIADDPKRYGLQLNFIVNFMT